VIACTNCDREPPPSLAAALQEGWSELARDDGPTWHYVGLCPSCLEQEIADSEAMNAAKESASTALIDQPPLPEKIDDHEKWKEEVRDVAVETSEGIRQVRVQGAMAEYEIGRTKDGKWAVQIRCAYTIGDQHGASSPWLKKGTRDECVELFVRSAKYHFGLKTEERQQKAQKQMLKLLAGEGLFGFVEPEPFPRAKQQHVLA
jgi:hypothetical protein